MIIGVTGSFGSGKTVVANMFSKYGFKVINVDKLYHGIYNNDAILKKNIKKEFGTLDRNKIKKIVFSDSKKLKKLNNITHPLIIIEIIKQIYYINKESIFNNNKIINKNKKLFKNLKRLYEIKIVIDIPLLFETKLEKIFDKIIAVKCSKKEQIKRILKKNKYSKKEIKQIIKSQMPLKEKIKRADIIIDNSKTIKGTQLQIKNIIENFN